MVTSLADALMVKVQPDGSTSPPQFKVVASEHVNYYRWLGYILLIDERDVRRADIDDTRRADEERGRRD